jgi:hypothetical protein
MKWQVKDGQSAFALTFQMNREGFVFAVESAELKKVASGQ